MYCLKMDLPNMPSTSPAVIPNAVPVQVDNHLPGAAALCGVLRGVRLAGAAISTEPAIETARRSAGKATPHGR